MMCPGESKNTVTCYNVRDIFSSVWLSIIKKYEAGYPFGDSLDLPDEVLINCELTYFISILFYCSNVYNVL